MTDFDLVKMHAQLLQIQYEQIALTLASLKASIETMALIVNDAKAETVSSVSAQELKSYTDSYNNSKQTYFTELLT